MNKHTSSSLEASDREAEAVATAPRVKLADIEAAIGGVYYTSGTMAAEAGGENSLSQEHVPSLRILTICLVVMRNGYTIIGKSAPASPENFNIDLGRKLAYEDCVRQIWPLMGFALRDRLSTHGLKNEPAGIVPGKITYAR